MQAAERYDATAREGGPWPPSALKRAILFALKDALPPIATLGDVVSDAGNDHACESGHGTEKLLSYWLAKRVTTYHVTVTQIVPHRLVQALAHVLRRSARLLGDALVNR